MYIFTDIVAMRISLLGNVNPLEWCCHGDRGIFILANIKETRSTGLREYAMIKGTEVLLIRIYGRRSYT